MAHRNKRIGRTLNTSPDSEQASVTANSGTAVTLVPDNNDRIYLSVTNPNNQSCWVKFQAATVDNIKTGEIVLPGGNWRMDTDTIYIGEVSVIMNAGGSSSIHYTEL